MPSIEKRQPRPLWIPRILWIRVGDLITKAITRTLVWS